MSNKGQIKGKLEDLIGAIDQAIEEERQRPYNQREEIEKNISVYKTFRSDLTWFKDNVLEKNGNSPISKPAGLTQKVYPREDPSLPGIRGKLVDNADLNGFTTRALRKNNIFTYGQLIECTEEEISNFEGIGPSRLDKIKDFLASHGEELKSGENKIVDYSKFGIRVKKALERLDVDAGRTNRQMTYNELTNYTASDLLKLRNCGVSAVDQIRCHLAEYGLSLKGDDISEEGKDHITMNSSDVGGHAYKVLYENNILTYKQLSKYSKEEISKIKGLGKQSLRIINDFLNKTESRIKSMEEKTLEMRIEMHGIPGRAAKVIWRIKAETYGDLIKYSENDLLKLRECGRVTVNQIKKYLAKYNFKLKED